MNTIFKTTILLIVLFFITGCVQKTKITMKVPGEINVKGVHKIAIIDFSSIPTNSKKGVFQADKHLLKMAKEEVIDTFYNEPFYSFSNLEIENKIKEKDLSIILKDRFDGLLYGKLWWKIAPEYKNIIPSKVTLENYTITSYVCGKTKKGEPIYCDAHLTTSENDAHFNKHYRAKNATLMMSLSFFKIQKDGKIEKITETFEVAKNTYVIENGEFRYSEKIMNDSEKLDKLTILKKQDTGFFNNLFVKKSEVVNSDEKTLNSINTIPSNYFIKTNAVNIITKKLQKAIAPSNEDIEINIEKGDEKVSKMFDYSAFNSISSYIVEKILANNNPQFYQGFYDIDFKNTAKSLVKYNHKKEFEDANDKRKTEEKKVYEPLTQEDVEEKAESFLKNNAAMIYNYALATEALGNYEKSLEIYRFLFATIDNKNQNYANGIGRALFALDMSDKVGEETLQKIKAKQRSRLN